MKKIDRRTFSQYITHSIIASALSRTFIETQAFGAVGKRKIMICTNPNGHYDVATTMASLTKGMSAGDKSKHFAYLDGINSSVQDADWHGSEGSLFSFNNEKKNAASFFGALPVEMGFLTVAGGDLYIKDSVGGVRKTIDNPAVAVRTFFGRSGTSNADFQLAEAGKKGILDASLKDIKAIKRILGKNESVIFDDYTDALDQLYKKYATVEMVDDNPEQDEQMMDPGNKPVDQMAGMNPKVVDPKPSEPKPKPSSPKVSSACKGSPTPSSAGNDNEMHAAMLDIAYHILACDKAQILTVNFGNSSVEPIHNTIHSASYQDGGSSFKGHIGDIQNRIGKLASRLAATPGQLENMALVYLSEGNAHFATGKFEPQHPKTPIPVAVFGSLGGAFKKKGKLTVRADQRNLWRTLADGLVGGKADLKKVNGDAIKPLAGV